MSGKKLDLPWKSVHFIGVGGVGMFGIAMILIDLGLKVSGSDTADSENLARLRGRGANVTVGHSRKNLPSTDAVVYSSAVPEENPEMTTARQQGIDCYQRGRFLALLADYFDTVVAIAGSHGKTTTTAMLTHILREAGMRPGYLIGGDVAGWNTPATAGRERKILITEVDESDGTQAFIHSDYAVVINIEDDHCWSVGGEQALHDCFVRFASQGRRLLAWETDCSRALLANHPDKLFLKETDAIMRQLKKHVAGRHNQINGSLAVKTAEQLGVEPSLAVNALKNFQGVQRRMSLRFHTPDNRFVVLEDYAHHPTELRAALETVREQWPDHKLTAIFQPHRFERVKRYADDFRRLLAKTTDSAIVFRPFSAWVADEQLADPAIIIKGIEKDIPCQYWQGDFEGLAATALDLSREQNADQARIFVVIGAGDVNRCVLPLGNLLAEKWLHDLQNKLTDALPGMPLDCTRAWSELTTMGVGSACPLLAEPRSEKELEKLLSWQHKNKVPMTIVGNGSNIVGTDQLDPRLIIRLNSLQFSNLKINGTTVECGARLKLSKLIETLLSTGPIDPAFARLGWIPAELAGAVRMNASCHGTAIGDFVEYIAGVNSRGHDFKISREELQWDYRKVNLGDDQIITRIGLVFPRSSPETAGIEYEKAGTRRRQTQPSGPSAGCVFRNPHNLSAGKLIEQCGLKGEQIGDCRVSEQHANFILSGKQASEADLIALIKLVIRRVYQQTGIRLCPEVRFAGSAAESAIEQAVPPLQLTVLAGGPSSEREISLRSAKAVATALEEAGHQVALVDVKNDTLPELPVNTDVVFPVLHGAFGEDGRVQSLLQKKGLPYVGSGPAPSRLMIDKTATKQVLKKAGIPTPSWWSLTKESALPPTNAAFPLMVKPEKEGSSMGISCVHSPGKEWNDALREAFKYSSRVLVEEFVKGREITVGIVLGQTLPVVEIVPPVNQWFDFDAKYEYKKGETEYFCPPRSISADSQRHAREMAFRAWHILEAEDMARFDFIVDADGVPWCLEVNSIPGFTATSLLPKAARVAGIEFVQLCAGLTAANLPGWPGKERIFTSVK